MITILQKMRHRNIVTSVLTVALVPLHTRAFSSSLTRTHSIHHGPSTLLSPWFPSTRCFLSSFSNQDPVVSLKRGDAIQVEVTRFGPLGASVEIVGTSHDPNSLIGENDPTIARGLILQKEIGYFRAARDGLDVVVGEILCAYVENVRDDGKIDISLRKPGGKGKAQDMEQQILDALNAQGGQIDVGDKSSPEDINKAFPGTSKATFKRGVAALFRKGKVQPGAYTTKLM
jgi:predicted RNA-binding protein with RPS1 domain